MQELSTKYFGTVEYEDRQIIRFRAGLPAFETELWFVAIAPAAAAPLVFLQSGATPDLCFLALPVDAVDSAYALELSDEDQRELGIAPNSIWRSDSNLAGFALVTVHPEGPVTANLLAPVVVNVANGRGWQAVRMDRTYSHQHPVRLAREEALCS